MSKWASAIDQPLSSNNCGLRILNTRILRIANRNPPPNNRNNRGFHVGRGWWICLSNGTRIVEWRLWCGAVNGSLACVKVWFVGIQCCPTSSQASIFSPIFGSWNTPWRNKLVQKYNFPYTEWVLFNDFVCHCLEPTHRHFSCSLATGPDDVRHPVALCWTPSAHFKSSCSDVRCELVPLFCGI